MGTITSSSFFYDVLDEGLVTRLEPGDTFFEINPNSPKTNILKINSASDFSLNVSGFISITDITDADIKTLTSPITLKKSGVYIVSITDGALSILKLADQNKELSYIKADITLPAISNSYILEAGASSIAIEDAVDPGVKMIFTKIGEEDVTLTSTNRQFHIAGQVTDDSTVILNKTNAPITIVSRADGDWDLFIGAI